MSTRIERNEAIELLTSEFSGATGIYLTDFTKVNVQTISRFRDELRKAGVKYIVVKNTLARIALERVGIEGLGKHLVGPVGVCVTKQDGVGVSKIIRDFKKTLPDLLPVSVAYVDGTIYTGEQVKALAELPSRNELLSMLLSVLNAPVTGLAGALNGIMTKFVGTLNAVKDQKEQTA